MGKLPNCLLSVTTHSVVTLNKIVRLHFCCTVKISGHKKTINLVQ